MNVTFNEISYFAAENWMYIFMIKRWNTEGALLGIWILKFNERIMPTRNLSLLQKVRDNCVGKKEAGEGLKKFWSQATGLVYQVIK